ncbi:helix-turn-helix domain-containing protein [Nonomuraea sp. NPDC005650]|uniref:helix-turn-helix domain-containing protein n=1 Tax=Nonomuraea sp. NPDC005650 TaxID=3157045 RepID=UPI0033A2CBC3
MAIIADLSPTGDRLLTSKEVARLFRVDPKTAARWGATGRLAAIRTPGGRDLRFPEAEVHAALQVFPDLAGVCA